VVVQDFNSELDSITFMRDELKLRAANLLKMVDLIEETGILRWDSEMCTKEKVELVERLQYHVYKHM